MVKKLALAYTLSAFFIGAGGFPATAQEVRSLADAHLLPGGFNLTPVDSTGHAVHIMPTVSHARKMAATVSTSLLTYHGGPIMPSIEIFPIFWVGALQGGGTATLTSHYEMVANLFANDYAGHSIAANNTQFYQTNPNDWVHGLDAFNGGTSSLGGAYIDSTAFPTSGCTDTSTPKNCITDAQLQAELKKVLTATGWTGGNNKIYLVFTGQGEGSCFDATSASCAYTDYCAYHGSYTSGSTNVIYGNLPYAVASACQGGASPTADPAADAVVSVASHEVSEAITDPLLTAWYDSSGSEIGDKCAWTYGVNSYDGALANQYWNGHYYELQMEFNNHTDACAQTGPN